ncbi:MAG TPA: hypothetical protein VFQ26_06760, partial [Nitrospiraceae bacterium]|nr:hypothetical protein [Nitrospiraceae bacterium]
MNAISTIADAASFAARPSAQPSALLTASPTQAPAADNRLREVFDEFVGQSFYQQLLGAMRKTVNKPAYFHGGRAEEVFQGQL